MTTHPVIEICLDQAVTIVVPWPQGRKRRSSLPFDNDGAPFPCGVAAKLPSGGPISDRDCREGAVASRLQRRNAPKGVCLASEPAERKCSCFQRPVQRSHAFRADDRI